MNKIIAFQMCMIVWLFFVWIVAIFETASIKEELKQYKIEATHKK